MHRIAESYGLARVIAVACLIALAVGMSFLLAGCKDTNTIKEIVYTQDADEVDHDNETKVRIASPDGMALEDVISSDYDIDEESDTSEQLLLNVIYASENPDTDLPTPPYVYDPEGTYSTEASEPAGASPDETTRERQDASSNAQEESDQSQSESEGTTEPSDEPGEPEGDPEGGDDNPSDDGKGAKEDDDPGEGNNPKTEPEEPGPIQVFDTTGDEPTFPEVGSIAACGQAAVIVQMLGGTDGSTALAAADAELLGSAFATVFADEGSANVAAVWGDGGASAASLDFAALLAAAPETVLVTNGAYFTEDQMAQLAASNISITIIPELTSATRITKTVDIVGKMLNTATGGVAGTRAADYIAYHDDLVARVEGVRGYGAYSGMLFDADAVALPPMFAARKWALLVDEWDAGAVYTGTGNVKGSISTAASGLGLSRVGYQSSPVSYYLGVAGVVNNGAAIEPGASYSGWLAPVWQFSTSVYDLSQVSWSSSAYSSRILPTLGQSFTKTTLTTAGTARNDIIENGFGGAKFPIAIVASQRMKDLFIQGSKGNGPYRAYGTETHNSVTFHGFLYDDVEVFSTIQEDIDLEDAILVNPHGLFSDWMEGSVESCLESAWIAGIDAFDNDWGGSARSEVASFYQQFYRYPISDAEVTSILAGV